MAKAEYKMFNCALDLRFDPAFRWWDQAGFIAESLIEYNPDLGFNANQNSTIHLIEPDTGLGVTFGLTSVNVAQQMTDGMSSIDDGKRFFEFAHKLAGIVVDGLRITNLQRLGFSCTRRLGTETVGEAVKEWDHSGLNRLTPNVFPGQEMDIRNLQFFVHADAFEHIQDMRMKTRAELFELTMRQNQGDTASVSIERIYKQPSEQRKRRLLETMRMQRVLADHPRAGIIVEFEWIADFPQKIDALVLERWLKHLGPLAAETHNALIRRQ